MCYVLIHIIHIIIFVFCNYITSGLGLGLGLGLGVGFFTNN